MTGGKELKIFENFDYLADEYLPLSPERLKSERVKVIAREMLCTAPLFTLTDQTGCLATDKREISIR